MPTTGMTQGAAKELRRQLNQELASGHGYEGLSLWCEDANLKASPGILSSRPGKNAGTHGGL
jgi:ferritin